MHVSEAASDGLTTDEDDGHTYASDAFELDDIGEQPPDPPLPVPTATCARRMSTLRLSDVVNKDGTDT